MKLQLNIGSRVVLAFAIVVFAMVCITMAALWRLDTANASTRYLVDDKLAKQQLTSQLLGTVRLSGNIALSIAKSDSLETADYFQSQLAAGEKASAALVQKLMAMPRDRNETALAKALLDRQQSYLSVQKQMFAFKDGGRTQEVDQLADTTFKTTFSAYVAAVDDLLDYQTKAGRALAADSSAEYGHSVVMLAACGIAAVAVGAALAWGIVRSVVVPLKHALEIAMRVADGDLRDFEIPRRGDEIGKLLQALRHMTARLGQTVRLVRDSAVVIDSASRELSAGNADLSGRTEHQASALEETVSSMAQLTGAVKANTGNAHQANALVASASKVAGKGGQVVGNVVATMDSLNDAATRIVDIIGVIDGIAFQTNILALNAAVEAARAGEQGRGFAVVANEVRNLAQRSANAAREIKQLINESVHKIEAGSVLTHEAGDTMSDIVASVERVTAIMAHIVAASAEQETGIGEINAAIADIDGVTQQNAALVEEAAATAELVHSQAAKLMEFVGFFTVDDGGAASHAAAASNNPAPDVRRFGGRLALA